MGKTIFSTLHNFAFAKPFEQIKSSLINLAGIDVELWQLAVLGILVVALIVCVVIAIVRSKKSREKRIKKYIECEEKAIELRKKIRTYNETVAKFKYELSVKKTTHDKTKAKIQSEYRELYGRSDYEFLSVSNKLLKLNEQLREITLRLQKKKLKSEERKSLQNEFEKLENEHSELSEQLLPLRESKTARDEAFKTRIDGLDSDFAKIEAEYKTEIANALHARNTTKAELSKIESSQIKINQRDAEAVLKQFRKQDDLDKKIRLQKAEEDLEKAKSDYQAAQDRKLKYEQERADAISSAFEGIENLQMLETVKAETEARLTCSATDLSTAETQETKTEETQTETCDNAIETADNSAIETAINAEETTETENVAENAEETTKAEETEDTTATNEVIDGAAEALLELENTIEKVDEANYAKLTDEVDTEIAIAEKTEYSVKPEEISEAQNQITTDSDVTAMQESETEPELTKDVIDDVDEQIILNAASEHKDAEQADELAACAITEISENDEIDKEYTLNNDNISNVETYAEENLPTDSYSKSQETVITANINEDETAPDDSEQEIYNQVAATDDLENSKIIRLPKIIHNDGIPATPIHKKSKFAKPVTKIVVKKQPVKPTTETAAISKEETKKNAYLGKWKTEISADGKYSAKLCASNGGLLLSTPTYSSEIGLKNGISSIKKHLASDNVTITANKSGKFVFKITAQSGRTIVTSEQYGARFQCEKALESAKRFAETAIIVK